MILKNDSYKKHILSLFLNFSRAQPKCQVLQSSEEDIMERYEKDQAAAVSQAAHATDGSVDTLEAELQSLLAPESTKASRPPDSRGSKSTLI